jgi:hypothetical protein
MDIVQPIRGEKSATLILPTNPAREAQSPSTLSPPLTDHGTLQSQMVLHHVHQQSVIIRLDFHPLTSINAKWGPFSSVSLLHVMSACRMSEEENNAIFI